MSLRELKSHMTPDSPCCRWVTDVSLFSKTPACSGTLITQQPRCCGKLSRSVNDLICTVTVMVEVLECCTTPGNHVVGGSLGFLSKTIGPRWRAKVEKGPSQTSNQGQLDSASGSALDTDLRKGSGAKVGLCPLNKSMLDFSTLTSDELHRFLFGQLRYHLDHFFDVQIF